MALRTSGTVAPVAAPAGIALTGAGAGIGLRYAQKTGLSVTSAAGRDAGDAAPRTP